MSHPYRPVTMRNGDKACADCYATPDHINHWYACNFCLPDDGEIVDTMVDDKNGRRNEQQLKLQGRLWFFPDGLMYVYYEPTHWRVPLT